jgi:Na+/melibiose symporter-like transporter
VVFADEVWGVGSTGLGLLSGMAGAGGVVGSMWVAWRHDSGRRAERQLLSMLGFGGFLLLFAQSPWFWPAVPAVLLANVFASIYGTLNNTAIQILIPDRVRGRISSFLMMSFSLPLLGTLPMSALAEARGAPLAVSLASVLAIAVALLFYAASPALRHMDTAVRRALLE